MRGSASTRSSLRIAVCLLALVAVGLVAAGSAGAVRIDSWQGGKAAVPQIVTATSSTCPGTVVMLTGAGFVNDGGIVSVSIGGVPAAEVVVGSDQYLYARVGSGATSGPIVVTTKAGTATATPNAIVVPCQSSATATTKPAVAGVKPVKAKGGKKITLSGSGFVGTTSVTVGGIKAAYAIPSDNVMYIIVPKDAKTGQDTIEIKNTLGSVKSFVVKSD